MMYCVSLDPGGTTGVCLVPNRIRPWDIRGEQLGPRAHHLLLLKQLTLWKPEVIVCEDFDNRGSNAAILESKEYIGVVRAYTQAHKGCTLVMQSASLGKGFWIDSKLRKCGMYVPGKHARDATRHYLYYRTFTVGDQSLVKQYLRPVTVED